MSAIININISISPLLPPVIELSEVRIGIVNFPSPHPASYIVFSSVEDEGILNSHSATSISTSFNEIFSFETALGNVNHFSSYENSIHQNFPLKIFDSNGAIQSNS